MDELYDALEQVNQFYRESNGIYHKIAVALNLSDTVFCILYTLTENDHPLDQRQLCTEWNLPKQTVNSAVAGLVRKGLVYLTPGRGHSKYVCLTDEGKRIAKIKIDPIRRMECRALQQMEPDERHQFLDLMSRYTQLLRTEATETISALKAKGAATS